MAGIGDPVRLAEPTASGTRAQAARKQNFGGARYGWMNLVDLLARIP